MAWWFFRNVFQVAGRRSAGERPMYLATGGFHRHPIASLSKFGREFSVRPRRGLVKLIFRITSENLEERFRGAAFRTRRNSSIVQYSESLGDSRRYTVLRFYDPPAVAANPATSAPPHKNQGTLDPRVSKRTPANRAWERCTKNDNLMA